LVAGAAIIGRPVQPSSDEDPEYLCPKLLLFQARIGEVHVRFVAPTLNLTPDRYILSVGLYAGCLAYP